MYSKRAKKFGNMKEDCHPFDIEVSLLSKNAKNVGKVSDEWHPFEISDFWKRPIERRTTKKVSADCPFDEIPFDEFREDDFKINTNDLSLGEKREKDCNVFQVLFPWEDSPQETQLKKLSEESEEDLLEERKNRILLNNQKRLNRKMRRHQYLKTKKSNRMEKLLLLPDATPSSYLINGQSDKTIKNIIIPRTRSKTRSSFSHKANETLELYKDDIDDNSLASSFLTNPSTSCDSSIESKYIEKRCWRSDHEREVRCQNKHSAPGIMYAVFFDSFTK
mmetsp:Transcript_22671/g.34261  ORF Transcript_22671/g.34261 Transcript_22671/m.34261 type:complete len:277 (+) Transcript_22671:240-1070(+)